MRPLRYKYTLCKFLGQSAGNVAGDLLRKKLENILLDWSMYSGSQP